MIKISTRRNKATGLTSGMGKEKASRQTQKRAVSYPPKNSHFSTLKRTCTGANSFHIKIDYKSRRGRAIHDSQSHTYHHVPFILHFPTQLAHLTIQSEQYHLSIRTRRQTIIYFVDSLCDKVDHDVLQESKTFQLHRYSGAKRQEE